MSKTVDQGGSIYANEWWVGTLVVLAGVLFAGLGIYLFSKRHLYRGGLLALGGVAALVSSPNHFTEFVEVNDRRFAATQGSWYTRSIVKLKFEEVEDVKVRVTESRRRFQTTQHFAILCRIKDGDARQVQIGNVMAAAIPEILSHFRRCEIPMKGLELLPESMK